MDRNTKIDTAPRARDESPMWRQYAEAHCRARGYRYPSQVWDAAFRTRARAHRKSDACDRATMYGILSAQWKEIHRMEEAHYWGRMSDAARTAAESFAASDPWTETEPEPELTSLAPQPQAALHGIEFAVDANDSHALAETLRDVVCELADASSRFSPNDIYVLLLRSLLPDDMDGMHRQVHDARD